MKNEEMKVMVKVELEFDLKTFRILDILAGDGKEGFNAVVRDACEFYTSSECTIYEILDLFEERTERKILFEKLGWVESTD